MNPFFSIIVPVYNTEKYLDRCVTSILIQSFHDYEVILVDDGSTDKSVCMCDYFAKKDNRVLVIHKENGGVSSARNVGLNKASGLWVLFVDSDDYIEECFTEIHEALYKKNMEGAIWGYRKVYQEGRIREFSVCFSEGITSANIIFDSVVGIGQHELEEWFIGESLGKTKELGSACRCAFSNRIIEKWRIRFSECIEYMEDKCFVLDYLQHVTRIWSIKKCWYNYLYDGHESSSDRIRDNADKVVQNRIRCFDYVVNIDYKKTEFEKYSGSICMAAIELAMVCSKSCWKYKTYISYIKQSWCIKAISDLNIVKGGYIRRFPFFLLKHHLAGILLGCCWVLNRLRINVYPKELR